MSDGYDDDNADEAAIAKRVVVLETAAFRLPQGFRHRHRLFLCLLDRQVEFLALEVHGGFYYQKL